MTTAEEIATLRAKIKKLCKLIARLSAENHRFRHQQFFK